jgi:hypothetical protein
VIEIAGVCEPGWADPVTSSGHRLDSVVVRDGGLSAVIQGSGSGSVAGSAKDENGRVLCLATGTLRRPDVSADQHTVTEAVLAAYRHGGLAGLSGLCGGWSAVLLDCRTGHRDLVLARGGAAAPELYYAGCRSRLRFASALGAVVADAAVDLRVDEQGLRECLAGHGRDTGATVFAGIRRLPADHWLLVDVTAAEGIATLPRPVPLAARGRRGDTPGPGEWRSGWDVEPPGSVRALAELPEAVRERAEPLPDVAAFLAWHATRPTEPTQAAAPDVVDSEELAGRWLRERRARVQGIFRSPAFHGRPYWDGSAVTEAFDRFCARQSRLGDRSAGQFWRVLTAELWLRLFIDRPRAAAGHPLGDGELEELGDRGARESSDIAGCLPHPSRHAAMVGADGSVYVRLPVRTRNVWPGDQLAEVVTEGVLHCGVWLCAGDVVIVAEKIVAIGQGRCMPVEQVTVRPLARLLARFVRRTPAGISLGLPEAFELAARQAGLARILAGSLAAALTRPFGVRGLFYEITGWEVAAIDSPDPDGLPPSDRCVKLAPRDPERASVELARHLSEQLSARIETAVVDANDIGAEVLGASAGVDRRLLISLLRDNPLGQDTQQTPVGIVRRASPELVRAAK